MQAGGTSSGHILTGASLIAQYAHGVFDVQAEAAAEMQARGTSGGQILTGASPMAQYAHLWGRAPAMAAHEQKMCDVRGDLGLQAPPCSTQVPITTSKILDNPEEIKQHLAKSMKDAMVPPVPDPVANECFWDDKS